MKEFRGKTAVITGAASGIGEALAIKCASEGMNLLLSDVDERNLNRLAGSLKDQSPKIIVQCTDVSKADQVEALADTATNELGGIDLLFNNAGVMLTKMSWEHTLEDWQWVLGVNLMGVIHGIKSFVPRMLAQGREGHVINTASIAGILPSPTTAAYSVSKHGVVALSETLLYELALANSKLNVSVICPGPVITRIVDSDRNRPQELVDGKTGSDQADQMFREMLQAGIEKNGMPASELTDIVFDAIRENKYWILPHKDYKDEVAKWADTFINETTPIFVPQLDF